MEFVPALGLLGDISTFVGSLILIRKEFRAIQEFKELKAGKRQIPTFAPNTLETEAGGPINTAEDLEINILTTHAEQTRMGACFLAAGFLLLVVTRVLEILQLGRPH